MNLLLNPNDDPACLRPEYIFFYDKKKNMIIDGVFSKIMYSNDCVSCAGMMFILPFEYQNPRIVQFTSMHAHPASTVRKPDITSNTRLPVELSDPTTYVKWNLQLKPCELNRKLVTMLIQYEEDILAQYKAMSGLKHSPVYSLGSQLAGEHIVVHCGSGELPEQLQITLKISGVWETSTHIGITYKLLGGDGW